MNILFCCVSSKDFLFLCTSTSHCPSNQDENCTNFIFVSVHHYKVQWQSLVFRSKNFKRLKRIGTVRFGQIFPTSLRYQGEDHEKQGALPWVVFEHLKSINWSSSNLYKLLMTIIYMYRTPGTKLNFASYLWLLLLFLHCMFPLYSLYIHFIFTV